MGAALLTCDRCLIRLPVDALNVDGFVACPGCNTPTRVLIFPAYFRPPSGAVAGETLLVDGESSCFYHPGKKAVVPCDGCGRFLCSLCDVELSGEHLCSNCIETGQRKGRLEQLTAERKLYDSQALSYAVGGLLFVVLCPPVSAFAASAAIYLVVRHWNSPLGLMRKGRWRYIIALLLAAGELGLLVLLVVFTFLGVLSEA